MQKHSLSLCLVVRDEEETIGRALKSALAVVDEVVVVDLGSSDNSRLIVEGYGARVVDHGDPDDTAGAYNAGIAAAYGDWILVMGADEILEPARPVDLGRLLADREVIAYELRIREEKRDGGLRLRDEPRLFRNHPRIRYRYEAAPRIQDSLHELADEEGTTTLECSLGVFRPPLEEETRLLRHRTQLRKLRRAADLEPDRAWYRYALAGELAVEAGGEVLPVKGFASLLDLLDEAWAKLVTGHGQELGRCHWLPEFTALRARSLRAAGRLEEAQSMLEQAIELTGASSALRLELGAVLVEQAGEAPETADLRRMAASQFEALLEGPADREPVWVDSACFHLWPRTWLGRCAMGDGDHERARAAFHEALEIEPACVAAWCGLAELAEREGRLRDALQIYLRAMREGSFHARAWLGGARVLERLGFADNAASWRARVGTLQPEHPELDRHTESERSPQEVAART